MNSFKEIAILIVVSTIIIMGAITAIKYITLNPSTLASNTTSALMYYN